MKHWWHYQTFKKISTLIDPLIKLYSKTNPKYWQLVDVNQNLIENKVLIKSGFNQNPVLFVLIAA